MASPIPTATLRRLAAAHDVDPRTILREWREPGSVKGMTGDRCRRAISEYRAARDGAPKAAAAGR